MELKDKYIVNMKPDGTFDALYCAVKCEGNDDYILITVPYKNVVRRNILPCIPFFSRDEDCPEKYIAMAFFRELLKGDEIKFLQLPPHSGWQECKGNKTSFASSEIVIPKLKAYYAEDILERKLIQTEKTFAEAAEALAKRLPVCWQYKFLLTVRVTSLLLYFYQLAGLTPDQMVVVEPKSESNAKAAIALLKNKNYNTNTCPLTENRTKLQHELHLMNDGVVLFRDTSYVEDHKKRDAGLNVLMQELYNCTGDESRSRHITVVLSDTPGNISSEFPAYFISLQGCPDIDNVGELQQAVGEFDSALIRLLSNSEVTENLVTNEFRKTTHLMKTEKSSENYMSLQMHQVRHEAERRNFLWSRRSSGLKPEIRSSSSTRQVLSPLKNLGSTFRLR